MTSIVFSDDNKIVETFLQKDIETKQEKISDVPEDERIRLDDDTIFRFSCTVKYDILELKLCEIGAFAPFLYEAELTADDIKKEYKMFRSCDTLEEMSEHINRLFKDKKIKLQKEGDDMKLIIQAYNISEVVIIDMKASRIMTSNKDDALMRLYKNEKNSIIVLKKMEEYFKSLGQDGNNILTKLKELKEQYQ